MEEELEVTATPEPTPTATPVPEYQDELAYLQEYIYTIEQRTEVLPEVAEYTKYMSGILLAFLVVVLMYFAHKFLRMFF